MTPEDDAVARLLDLNERARAAWDAADWAAYGSAHTEDLVVVDHRPASLGTIQGRETWLEATRVMREMFVSAATRVIEQYAVAAYGSLAHTRITCVTHAGLEIEVENATLNTVRDGLMNRIEFFPIEHVDEAVARLDELGAGAREMPMEG